MGNIAPSNIADIMMSGSLFIGVLDIFLT